MPVNLDHFFAKFAFKALNAILPLLPSIVWTEVINLFAAQTLRQQSEGNVFTKERDYGHLRWKSNFPNFSGKIPNKDLRTPPLCVYHYTYLQNKSLPLKHNFLIAFLYRGKSFWKQNLDIFIHDL